MNYWSQPKMSDISKEMFGILDSRILPKRSDYGEGGFHNIAINFVCHGLIWHVSLH